jgi:hypothetical protein
LAGKNHIIILLADLYFRITQYYFSERHGNDGHCWCYCQLCIDWSIWHGSQNVSKHHSNSNNRFDHTPRGKLFDDFGHLSDIYIKIKFQHVLLVLKIWISYAIPDIPNWVATEVAKIEWRRREAEKSSPFPFITPSASLDTSEQSAQTESVLIRNHPISTTASNERL